MPEFISSYMHDKKTFIYQHGIKGKAPQNSTKDKWTKGNSHEKEQVQRKPDHPNTQRRRLTLFDYQEIH